MARKVCHVILIILLASAHLGAAAPPNWVDDLVANINEDVHHRIANINEDVHHRIANINEGVQHIIANTNKNIEDWNTQLENSMQQMREQLDEALKNLPRDKQGHLITTGNNIIINSVNGVTMIKTAKSGYTTNGVPYTNVTTDLSNGEYLYHDKLFYNSTSNAMERICWRQNLTNPGAQLESLECLSNE